MNKPSMPPGAISGPSVWYGRDLQARSDWIRTFRAGELAELDAAVRGFKTGGTPLADISPASFPLPSLGKTLGAILDEMLEGRGFAMLRGFPVDRYTREEQAIAYLG